MRQYVFGYGSLICSESRAVTAAALGGSSSDTDDNAGEPRSIPVRVKNWVRLWNVRGYNTYLGVECVGTSDNDAAVAAAVSSTSQPHSCVGVLFPLPSSNGDGEALKALDIREKAYKRHRVELGLIERVDDLLIEEESAEAIENKYYKDTFLGKDSPAVSEADEEVYVWIYVPLEKYRGMARPKEPILQSYVDVCVKGSLSFSKAFAKEFVEGTYGWYPGHSHLKSNANDNDNDNNNDNDNVQDGDDNEDEGTAGHGDSSSCWVDDRNNPIYSRCDKEYSLQNSEALDAVFDPKILSRRSR